MPRLGPPPRPRKYQPLADFLATQKADTVTLSFAMIERLIDSPLPISAYVVTSFWRGKPAKGARAWQAAGWEAQRVDRYANTIEFARIRKREAAMPVHRKGRPARPSKYQPLAEYLRTQAMEVQRLTLAEIEALLGFQLPVNASVDGSWWRYGTGAWVRALAAAGWQARLHIRERAVVFTRVAGRGE